MFPWYAIIMLGFESTSVMTKRLARLGRGGAQSFDEIGLMFTEKVSAAVEAGLAVMSGAPLGGLVDSYRVHVAANEARLSN